jgi:hypothetical protein
MNRPPEQLGGATVVRWSVIDDRQQPTGVCRHLINGELQGPAAALAICQYEGETAYYLFGCDSEWNTVTDTWHPTFEEALEQAESEYAGVSHTWNVV